MDEKEKQKKEMENKQVKKVLKHHLDELGATTYEEKSVLVIFLMLVSLWFFRSPGFMTGWGDALSDNYNNKDADKDIAISDGTAAVLMTSILFVLPKKVFFNLNVKCHSMLSNHIDYICSFHTMLIAHLI